MYRRFIGRLLKHNAENCDGKRAPQVRSAPAVFRLSVVRFDSSQPLPLLDLLGALETGAPVLFGPIQDCRFFA